MVANTEIVPPLVVLLIATIKIMFANILTDTKILMDKFFNRAANLF